MFLQHKFVSDNTYNRVTGILPFEGLFESIAYLYALLQIAMIKVAGARASCKIVDRAIQVYGAEGLSQDTLLARCYTAVRSLRIADGPDEVHLETVCKEEIKAKL